MSQFPYTCEVFHEKLNRRTIVGGNTPDEAEYVAEQVYAQWNDEWTNKCLNEADEIINTAQQVREMLHSIVSHNTNLPYPQASEFFIIPPFSKSKPKLPEYQPIPADRPERQSPKYTSYMPLLAFVYRPMKEKFIAEKDLEFKKDLEEWERHKNDVVESNNHLAATYQKQLEEYEHKKNEYAELLSESEASQKQLQIGLINEDPDALKIYYEQLIKSLEVPMDWDIDLSLGFKDKSLIVYLELPSKKQIPAVDSATFNDETLEVEYSSISEQDIEDLYKAVIYQIILTLSYRIFNSEYCPSWLDSVVINGFTDQLDKAIGKVVKVCVVSVIVNRDNIENIYDLDFVSPEDWFKNAKGMSTIGFDELKAIKPIMRLDTADSRFVEGYSVIDTLDLSNNLAAMDWQDFENLIRDLFDKEFQDLGGEVKITQASRDGGVDAVVFDPDPIRGGKIVIQAKRYTNVVNVSAVRDLYGTVMNEGANKGILITTSHFGADAYKFSKDKPLTLIDGGQLLALLQKHGYKAHIDIAEAKEWNKLNKK